MHKCDTCVYKGEHSEQGFRAEGVCTKEHDLAKAVLAYKAQECPFAEKKETPMTDREKLVKLIEDVTQLNALKGTVEETADYLISHGVTVKEMQQPIPLEDIVETILVTPCWVEYRKRFTILNAVILDRDSVDIFRKCDHEYLPRKEYGKTWRAWDKFPTDEERKAAKWE